MESYEYLFGPPISRSAREPRDALRVAAAAGEKIYAGRARNVAPRGRKSPKRRSSFGKAPRRDTISLRSTHARLYRRARSRRHQRKIARARNLAESLSRLGYNPTLSRVFFRLPQDR